MKLETFKKITYQFSSLKHVGTLVIVEAISVAKYQACGPDDASKSVIWESYHERATN